MKQTSKPVWCDILDCVCGSCTTTCTACKYHLNQEKIREGNDENYGVGEYGRCWLFGTRVLPLDEVCLGECPRGVRNRCNDHAIALEEADKKAYAVVFASLHQVKRK